MSPDRRPALRVRGTEDVLALIPLVLGFQPEASLVLVTVDDATDGVLTGARLDLPGADEPTTPVRAALDQVIAVLGAGGGVSIVLAGYGPAERVEPIVATAREILHAAGIALREALRVADGRFWRLPDTGPTAYPPDGVPFDPSTSSAAAAAVYAGFVAFPDRKALAATLAPVTGPARERMVAATVTACALVTAVLDTARAGVDEPGKVTDAVLDTPLGQALQAAARRYLTQVQDSYRAGPPADDEPVATLTVLLELPSLWEFAARRTTGQAWQIEMWSDLVRRAEPPFTAPAATLLALCALQAGHGPLAGMAVERALDADPQDRFAQVLDRAIAAGIDPDTVTTLLSD